MDGNVSKCFRRFAWAKNADLVALVSEELRYICFKGTSQFCFDVSIHFDHFVSLICSLNQRLVVCWITIRRIIEETILLSSFLLNDRYGEKKKQTN